ncbi:MAG: hypothetical protein JOZ37_06750 [Actinobacteria bacterium]|nr:hypothetical protein [Actinomycetota bacterium]MBV9663647.1 hypothetical protein [Actinomycetota bacterium]
MNIKQKIAAAAVGVALLGGGAGLAVAMGGTSSAATTDTAATAAAQAPGQKGARRPGAQFLRRVVHGDLTVKAKDGFEKVTYDRGTVTAKNGNSFTLQRPDNATVTIKVDNNTKYRGISSIDDLTVNKPAIVVSKDGTALTVGQRNGAKTPAPADSGA